MRSNLEFPLAEGLEPRLMMSVAPALLYAFPVNVPGTGSATQTAIFYAKNEMDAYSFTAKSTGTVSVNLPTTGAGNGGDLSAFDGQGVALTTAAPNAPITIQANWYQ